MPFCPACAYEYREGVKTCPECKVDLIGNLPRKPPTFDGDMDEIYMVPNRMEADLISSLLREHGIEHLIRDMRVFPVMPDPGLQRARLRVAVQSDRSDEARRLITEAREDGAVTDQGRFL